MVLYRVQVLLVSMQPWRGNPRRVSRPPCVFLELLSDMHSLEQTLPSADKVVADPRVVDVDSRQDSVADIYDSGNLVAGFHVIGYSQPGPFTLREFENCPECVRS